MREAPIWAATQQQPAIRRDRSAMPDPSGGVRDGRVLSRSRPPCPSSIKRSCQGQTQVFDLSVWRDDLVGADAIGAQQHDPGSPHMLLQCVTIPRQRLQTFRRR